MNRRNLLKGLLALTGLTLGQGAQAGWAAGHIERTTFRCGLRYHLKHPMVTEVLKPWIETLRQRSHERLNIQLVSAGEMCPDEDIISAVLTDTMSLGVISPGLVVPPMPVSSYFDSPMLFSNARIGSLVMWDMLQNCEALQNEYALVHMLWAWMSAPMLLHTLKKPVRCIAEARGLKVVTWSSVEANIATAMGALPVHSTSSNSSELLQRGLADGIICPFPPLQSFGLIEHIKYTLEVPLTSVSFVMCMNDEVWHALPANWQALLTETTGRAMSDRCGKFLDAEAAQVREVLRLQGHNFIQPSPAEVTQWHELTAPMRLEAEKKLANLRIPQTQGMAVEVERVRNNVLLEVHSE